MNRDLILRNNVVRTCIVTASLYSLSHGANPCPVFSSSSLDVSPKPLICRVLLNINI